MSWNAKRYTLEDDDAWRRKEGSERKQTKHHVPPKHPDPFPRVINVDERHHRAYHLLFGAAKNFEDAVQILRRDWWQS